MFVLAALACAVPAAVPSGVVRGGPARSATTAEPASPALPPSHVVRLGDQVARVLGPSLAGGVDAVSSADRFVALHAATFGARPEDLVPAAPDAPGGQAVPLMPQDDGRMKFTLVRYAQAVRGIPVFRAALGVLVRNVQIGRAHV